MAKTVTKETTNVCQIGHTLSCFLLSLHSPSFSETMETQQQQQPQPKTTDEKLSLDIEHFEPKTLTREQIKSARAAAALQLAALREERKAQIKMAEYSSSRRGEGGCDV
ncbi:hypothetical protein MANES_18G086366v8 [Manihot esculenta]|uniref:Uncharacterized protein n=1 Tax=Manihot esculenta TaxID=3983 RepID=A0ACB7FZA6_MANES|nr:hypothetical protein MANES_18G086366v8 [Manihot esculenta]